MEWKEMVHRDVWKGKDRDYNKPWVQDPYEPIVIRVFNVAQMAPTSHGFFFRGLFSTTKQSGDGDNFFEITLVNTEIEGKHDGLQFFWLLSIPS